MLQSKVAKNIEVGDKEVTEAHLENWFKEFKWVIDEFGILQENIYNMDETGSGSWMFKMLTIVGFNIGKRACKSYVVCSSAEKKVYQVERGHLESVIVIECISGDGSLINPLVIFKGESLQTL